MTVGELIDMLCEVPQNVEVKLALQPTYPMVGHIKNVCVQRDADGNETKVWIACSDNEDYGCPEDVWDADEICDDEDYDA